MRISPASRCSHRCRWAEPDVTIRHILNSQRINTAGVSVGGAALAADRLDALRRGGGTVGQIPAGPEDRVADAGAAEAVAEADVRAPVVLGVGVAAQLVGDQVDDEGARRRRLLAAQRAGEIEAGML